jgi:SagB-type dehydrogenase family enzyme
LEWNLVVSLKQRREMPTDLERTLKYHERTKHHFGRYAPGPARLEWATQPDPFRRYQGAPLLALEKVPAEDSPPYEAALCAGNLEPRALDRRSLSQLFFDSLALSAWKRAGPASWALRVNPSSGNLHPTEGYLLCGPVAGLLDGAVVAHYAPLEHALEVRAGVPAPVWQALAAGLPQGSLLLGLSSIHWREAWKYGERAFRYCQHDVGHAIAALSVAAAGLGWQASLLDELAADQLRLLLGLEAAGGAEPEEPDCLLAVYPQGGAAAARGLPAEALEAFAGLRRQGMPNTLSPSRVHWSAVEDVAAATAKTVRGAGYGLAPDGGPPCRVMERSPEVLLRPIIRRRRSAVAMEPGSSMDAGAFFRVLAGTMPRLGRFPFNALPWEPQVHLALFVHRVSGLAPGLYFLVRNPGQEGALRAALREDFPWEVPPACPKDLPLYRLLAGDARAAAQQLSCHQDIAADGCFSLGMIARFREPLDRFGPWFYPRLFWECGAVGQMLYLEAEATGLRGTGIGCFFDDAVHDLLGLEAREFQSLYHFTVGQPLDDPRLVTLPAYPG